MAHVVGLDHFSTPSNPALLMAVTQSANLVRSRCRTKNQRLGLTATNCDEVPQMSCPARLSSDAATSHRNASGFVVGTKLGTK